MACSLSASYYYAPQKSQLSLLSALDETERPLAGSGLERAKEREASEKEPCLQIGAEDVAERAFT